MELRRGRGIVLSSSPCGEGDVLSSILTESHGKGKFVFRGIKKSRRRSHSASEPGVLITLNYYHRDEREISTLGDFTVENGFPGVRDSLDQIYSSRLMLEVSDKTCGAGECDTRLFRLLSAAMASAESTPFPVHLTAFYLLHLLSHQGILPGFNGCALCGSPLTGGGTLRRGDLHPLCPDCGTGFTVTPEAWAFIQSSINGRFRDMDCGKFCPSSIRGLLYALISFIEDHYRVEIKSKGLMLRD